MKKTVEFTRKGYGQWSASTIHYGKEISIHFTDSHTYDVIHSQDRGYKSSISRLRARIIRENKS